MTNDQLDAIVDALIREAERTTKPDSARTARTETDVHAGGG